MSYPTEPSDTMARALLFYAIANEMSMSEAEFKREGGKYHTFEQCAETRSAGAPPHCFVHDPTDHHMRSWPIIIRASSLIERQCPHGVGHPDPDSAAFLNWRDGHNSWGVHGCDGCCFRKD